MDAIKKKMQAMKLEKENAFDKADQLEQKLGEQKTVNEQVGPRQSVKRSKVKEIIVLIKARSFLDELNLEHLTS